MRSANSDVMLFEAAQLAKVRRGLADAEAGRFASAEQIATLFNKYKSEISECELPDHGI